MVVRKEKIKKNGDFHIPEAIMEELNLKTGGEVILRIEKNRLIIEPERKSRTKLKIKSNIVDELIENEDMFDPEAI